MTSKAQVALRAALASALALAVAAPLAAPGAANAQVASTQAAVAQTLVVAKDKSVAFRLQYPVGEIVVASPDVLQLVATTDQSFYVRGKSLGSTNLLVYDKQHRLIQVIDVHVGYDTEALDSDLALALPADHITAVNFAGGLLLRGEAASLNDAVRAQAIAERYAPKAVSSELKVHALGQVMVEVRVIEVDRTALKELGVNLNAANNSHFKLASGTGALPDGSTPQGVLTLSGSIHGVGISATLQALETKGLVKTLAKPDLIAKSGEEASFLAGGEFPYPVPNGPQEVSIVFKPFGVKLDVTPTIEDNGQIQLKVAPEVSALDVHNELNIDGFTMPSLTTRRANTTVELADGQSFAIAGLFQQDYSNAVNQIPWASDIPVLGALFRSTSWKRDESELLIIVTPHIIAPSDKLEDISTPFDAKAEPGLADEVLTGKSLDKPYSKPLDIGPKAGS
jgi:pilus assembly protein CpaC